MAYLQCECEQETFVKVNKLRTTQAGGVVEEIAGWRCFNCGVKVDTLSLMRKQELKQKRQEVESMQREILENDEQEQKRKAERAAKKADKAPGESSVSNLGNPTRI